jgi:hypothetical protein
MVAMKQEGSLRDESATENGIMTTSISYQHKLYKITGSSGRTKQQWFE